jgi:bifunctional DNA-binding transcriptional regulator/antitoxin component of YhaV-PrlF toxin-antitoxin module
MESTVTTKNMISIPQAIARRFGIEPGWKLDWRESERQDEIIVKVIPDRSERGRRIMGKGMDIGLGRDAIAELVAERESDG